jgi:hypothetical protein
MRWNTPAAATMEGGSVRSPLAGPCSGSLMPDEISLFTQINSLFGRKSSLFGCVGNSIRKANQYGRLGRRIRADSAPIRENSLYFPWNQE